MPDKIILAPKCQNRRYLHGLAEAHLIADQRAAAVAQREADALALERHQPGLQLGGDARVALAQVRQRARRLIRPHRSAMPLHHS